MIKGATYNIMFGYVNLFIFWSIKKKKNAEYKKKIQNLEKILFREKHDLAKVRKKNYILYLEKDKVIIRNIIYEFYI